MARTWHAHGVHTIGRYYGERREGVDGFGDATAAIKGTLDSLYEYKRDNKPVQRAAAANLEGVLNTLHASARNNNRPLHVPVEGHNIPDLEQDWAGLEQQEEDYERAALDSFQHFQRLECTIARFKVKADKLDNWIGAQVQLFTSDDYGSSSVANLALLEVFEGYTKQLALNKLVILEKLPRWCEDDDMALHADHADLVQRAADLHAQMEVAEGQGVAYKLGLEASKVEYAKKLSLFKPDAWIDDRAAFFAGGPISPGCVRSTILRLASADADAAGADIALAGPAPLKGEELPRPFGSSLTV